MSGTQVVRTVISTIDPDNVAQQTSADPNLSVVTSAITVQPSSVSTALPVETIFRTLSRASVSQPTGAATPTPYTGEQAQGGGHHNWIIGLVCGIVSLDIILIILCICCRRVRRKKKREQKRLEKERQRALAGNTTDNPDGEGIVNVNLGVIEAAHPVQQDRTFRSGRRRNSDSSGSLAWEDAPRAARPDVVQRYVARPGGVNVANDYMASQREKGWVSQGLMPVSAKRFNNDPSDGNSKKRGGFGFWSKLAFGSGDKSNEEARETGARELSQFPHQAKEHEAKEHEVKQNEATQYPTIQHQATQHQAPFIDARQGLIVSNNGQDSTEIHSLGSPEQRIPFGTGLPAYSREQPIQPQETGTVPYQEAAGRAEHSNGQEQRENSTRRSERRDSTPSGWRNTVA